MNSNDDIPADELLLAMMLQNVGARGWKAHKESFFVSKSGRNYFNLAEAPSDDPIVGCCAVGACLIQKDSEDLEQQSLNMVTGNDSPDTKWGSKEFITDRFEAEHVGYAFQQALKDDL